METGGLDDTLLKTELVRAQFIPLQMETDITIPRLRH